MSSAPLNITVSIGDVSFHLSPRPPNLDGDDDPQSSPPSNSESSSPPPPIVVVGYGSSPSPSSPPSSTQENGGIGGSGIGDGDGAGDGDQYFVDLSSFTGTLRIARSSPPPSALVLPRSRPAVPPSLEDDSSSVDRSKVRIKSLIDRYEGGRDASRSPPPESRHSNNERAVRFSMAGRGGEVPPDQLTGREDATTMTPAAGATTMTPAAGATRRPSTLPPNSSAAQPPAAAPTSSSPGDDHRNAATVAVAVTAASSSTSTIDNTARQSPQKPGGRRRSSAFSLSPPRSTRFAAVAHRVMHQVALAGKDVVDAFDSAGGASVGGGGKRAGGDGGKVGGPSSVRRRGSRKNAVDDDDDADDDYRGGDAHGGTELHVACASRDSVDLSRALLLRRDDGDLEDDVHRPDRRGRLPIHVLSMNRILIVKDPDGCEEVALALIELMGPEKAVQALHSSSGLAPFVYAIGSWTERLHSPEGASRGDASVPPAISVPAGMSDEDNARGSVASSAASIRRRVPYRSLFLSSPTNESSVSFVNRSKLLYLPASVTISDHEVFAIRMLSRMIDDYPEKTREAILTNIASVPLFLKSVLLINDPEKMTELTNSTLVKHVVMDKRSINVWLCAMLTDTKDVKMRAAIFFKLLSGLTFQDLASSSQSPERYSDKEIERFATIRKETFNAIYCW